MSGASAAPVWSTPTFPNVSATSRKIIVSDGTNWIPTTETYAVPGAIGNLLVSDGTNWISALPTFNQNTTGTASNVTGIITTLHGGTGSDLSSGGATGDLMVANGVNTFGRLADIATGNSLISGGVGVAPSWGKIGLGTHVTGTLPVGNGGTNSSSALNNNRIMVSNSGSIVEANALTDGQMLIGATGSAPIAATLTAGNGIAISNSAGSVTIANNISVSSASAATTITNNSGTYVVATGMSITLAAGAGGDYLVFFTGTSDNNGSGNINYYSIFSNGTVIAASEVSHESNTRQVPISTQAYVTGLTAGQTIDVRWKVSGGTGSLIGRTLIIQKVK